MNPNRAEKGRAVLNNVSFWKKFFRFFLLGLSVVFLMTFASIQVQQTGNVFAQNPNPIPIPPPPPPPTCTEVRQYNECTGCNTSRRVSQDSCGNYNVIVASQPDAACTDGCPVTPPPAPPAQSCPDDLRYCDAAANKIVHKHGGYWDGSQCVYAFDVEGSCNVTPPPPPAPPAPPAGIVCNDNEIGLNINPSSVNSGQSINFGISGDASTWIGDSFSGGAANCSGPWNNQTCTATQPGNYTWTHTWKHCVGDVNNCSAQCSKSANFTVIGAQPTPTPPSNIVCNNNEVSLNINPSSANLGQSINFSISGDASTWIGDNISGGVSNCSGPWNSITCNAIAAGNYTWTHTWKHCIGNVNNCSGVCSESAGFNIIGANPTPTPTPTPTPSGSPVPTPTPTPTPIPSATPTPTVPPQGGTCPVGSVAQFKNNMLVCIVNTNTNNNNNQNTNNNSSSSTSSSSSSNTNNITFGNVGTGTTTIVPATVIQPQVAGVSVTTLPKTGLPAIAWSALAFIPAGFRMRRFSKIKKDLQDDPNFIWENRKFKAGS